MELPFLDTSHSSPYWGHSL